MFDSDQSADALNLIKEKGIYHYSYMTDRSKFAETELPAREYWKNSLDNGKLQITEEEIQKEKLISILSNVLTLKTIITYI